MKEKLTISIPLRISESTHNQIKKASENLEMKDQEIMRLCLGVGLKKIKNIKQNDLVDMLVNR